jgi:hypothetical protein
VRLWGRQNGYALLNVQDRNGRRFNAVQRQIKSLLRTTESKEFDPTGLIVRMPTLGGVVGMVIRLYRFKQMCVNKRYRTAMIIPVMKMKKRGRQQRHEHCAGSHASSQLLHMVRFWCTLERMSTATPA